MRFLIYSLIAIVLFVLYIRFIERRTVFLPYIGKSEGSPADMGMRYDDVYIKTSDGLLLHGWFVPAAVDSAGAVTFLFLHGNAGNINNRVEKVHILHEMGGNVFVIDYRGYGLSEGKPTEKGIYLDAQAAFDDLAARQDIDHDKIIIYGVSLGGAPAAELALRRPAAGLVLHSTFTSAKDMARKIFPIAPPFLIQTKMATVEKISRITIPKLIIHAPDDEVIPYWMGKKLYETAAAPKEFLHLEGEHNDAHLISQDVYQNGVRRFLKTYFENDDAVK